MQRSRLPFNISTGGGLLAIVLWSMTFAVARSLSEQVGTFTAAASVYLTGGLICVVRLCCRGNPVARSRSYSREYLFGCGFLFVVYSLLIYLAVGLAKNREELLEVALLNYLWPAGTILLSVPLLHQRAGGLLVPGTAVALMGVFLVVTQGASVSWSNAMSRLQTNPVPLLLALVAAGAWALYSNLTRRWNRPDGRGAVEWFIPATGALLLGLRLFWPEAGHWTARAGVEAVLLGSITALAYALWDSAMRKGNLLLVAACSYLTPLLSTVVSCVYLHVAPHPKLWIGSLLIVAGSLVSWRSVSAPT